MVSKDQSIIMQVAAKIAADLTPKTENLSSNIASFYDAYEAVCEIILKSQGFSVASPDQPTEPAPTQASNDEALFQQSFPTASPTPAPSGGFTVRIKGKQHGPIPQWLNDACAIKGVTEVWDNRDGLQANPKRPWFKSTTGNEAFWAPR